MPALCGAVEGPALRHAVEVAEDLERIVTAASQPGVKAAPVPGDASQSSARPNSLNVALIDPSDCWPCHRAAAVAVAAAASASSAEPSSEDAPAPNAAEAKSSPQSGDADGETQESDGVKDGSTSSSSGPAADDSTAGAATEDGCAIPWRQVPCPLKALWSLVAPRSL